MRKFYLAIIAIVLCSFIGNAQADRYWVGTSGGNWSINANWSATSGGAGGAGAPGSTQNAIFDADATVTLDFSPTVNSLYIKQTAGGVGTTVTLNSTATRTFTVNAGAVPNPAFRVEASCVFNYAAHSSSNSNAFNLVGSAKGELLGTFNVAGPTAAVTPRISFSSANNLTVKNGGKLQFGVNSSSPLSLGNQSYIFESGSVMEVNRNGFAFPDGNFDVNSLVRFLGFTNSGVVSYGGFPAAQMGNVEYNCAGQSATINMSFPSNYTIKGNLRILNTNGQRFQFATTLTGLTINGNLEIGMSSVSLSNSGTSITVPAKSLTVKGSLAINNGGLFDLQQSASGGNTYLKLDGDLSIATGGTLLATGNGTTSVHELEFNGTALQTVSVAGTISGQPRLRVNNPAGLNVTTNLVLPSSLNSRLTLTDGNVNMGTNLLHLQNPSTTALAGGTASSHIIGRLRRATNAALSPYVFPVSTSPGEVGTVKIYPADAAGTDYEVEFFRPNAYPRTAADKPSGIVGISDYNWNITRPAGSAGADLEFVYGGLTANGGIAAPLDVRVLRWNGASPWENLGGTDAGGNAVAAAGITTFGPFALGSVSQTLLLQFVSLSGYKGTDANQLQWKVRDDKNIGGYFIERSTNGRSFNQIDYLPAKAQSTGLFTEYQYADKNPPAEQCFYRLKAVDEIGKVQYSNTIYLKANRANQLSVVSIVPNPMRGQANLVISAPKTQDVVIEVYSLPGVLVMQQHRALAQGNNTVLLQHSWLRPGMHLLRVYNTVTKEECTAKLVVR